MPEERAVGGAAAAEKGEPPVPRFHRMALIAFVIIPLLGFVAAGVASWGLGLLRPADLALLVAFYLFTGLGITAGYHRLFTHRSFKTVEPIRRLLAVAGSMAAEGPVLNWVAGHRCHHSRSDQEGDPHSPHNHGEGVRGLAVGMWHAHLGWLFEPADRQIELYARDLVRDRGIALIDRLFLLWVALGLAIPALVGLAVGPGWKGALLGFLWGGLARVFLVQHVTWSINSVCHVFGSRAYASNDESVNNAVCGILGLGEGWHNNHHAFPTSARHGLEWWQFDLTWIFIRGLERLGLAWDLRLPAPDRLAAKAL